MEMYPVKNLFWNKKKTNPFLDIFLTPKELS